MTERAVKNNNIAILRNVVAMTTLVQTVVDQEDGLPRIGLFYGWSGFGKSVAATYAANMFNAHIIEMRSAWGRRKLVEQIATEIGLEPKGTVADVIEQIGDTLIRTGRPLFIDEADYLVSYAMVEIVRDIYELSRVAVILIGEEQMPTKLERWERFCSRMVAPVPAEAALLEDVGYLAPLYCKGVEVASDLQEALFLQSRHSVRRIANNLKQVLQFARQYGLDRVSLADWGDNQFYDGTMPGIRRGMKP
jgi:DNA transposition AAA+ family ATPase